MKILIVHNKYKMCGGEERVFKNEVRLLEENGNNIEKVVVDNAEINTLLSVIRTGIFSFYNPVSSKMIRNKVDEFDPDLIHVHNFFPLISPSVFFRKTRKKIPLVMTLHNFRLICANAMLFRKNDTCEKCIKKKVPLMGILHKCYRNSASQTLAVVLIGAIHKLIGTWKKRVNKYICLTEFQKNKIMESSLNLKEDQIDVKPNFVFDRGFEINGRNSFYIYVGRIDIEKGVGTMIEAFVGTGYKLRIIGEGSNEEYIKKLCESSENIEFLGARDHDFVMMQMKIAKGLIFPSKIYEGFPMVIAEALSCGTPVITSDIGSQAEIIKDGENGLHFKTGDHKDLRKKVKELFEYNNTAIYENSRKSYKNLYNENINYSQLINIYKELIKTRPN